MTGLTLSGLYYLHQPFADRMAGIVFSRLNAGQEPFPSQFRAQTGGGQNEDRQQRWQQRADRQAEIADEVYDDDGFFDQARYDLYTYRKAGGGSVAVIPITGSMARVGYCGIGGNEYTARILDLAAQHPKIQAVILKIDTPGGTVDSTRMLADRVANFAKPLLVWTPFCCSAGYYVASQAREIWVEDQTVSLIGSIGVLMVYVDQREALTKQGYEVTIFRADGSDDKARMNGIEKLSDADKARIAADLTACRTEFLGYVRRGRAGLLTDEALIFKAGVFGPQQALDLGLADRIGSIEACLQHALTLTN